MGTIRSAAAPPDLTRYDRRAAGATLSTCHHWPVVFVGLWLLKNGAVVRLGSTRVCAWPRDVRGDFRPCLKFDPWLHENKFRRLRKIVSAWPAGLSVEAAYAALDAGLVYNAGWWGFWLRPARDGEVGLYVPAFLGGARPSDEPAPRSVVAPGPENAWQPDNDFGQEGSEEAG